MTTPKQTITPKVIVLGAPSEDRPCYHAVVEAGDFYYRVNLGLGQTSIRGLNPEARAGLDKPDGPSTQDLYDITRKAIDKAVAEQKFTILTGQAPK